MKRKILSFILLFALLLGQITVFPKVSCARSDKTLDYTGLLRRVREIDPTLETPTPIFTLTANEKTYTVKPDLDIAELYKNRSQVPYLKGKDGNDLIVPIGTKIKLDASPSEVGSGSKIGQYDWQIYKAYSEKEGKYTGGIDEKSTRSVELAMDKPGDYLIFLNVADNYNKIEGFSNWSEKGDWRSEYIKPMNFSGVIIEGWYFTVTRIKAIGAETPIAEFEIHYEATNYTDNKDNPVIVNEYPITVDLVDKSISEGSEIIKWNWQVWRNDQWEIFSKSQNPNLNFYWSPVEIRLQVTDKNGITSEFAKHTFYSKTQAQHQAELQGNEDGKEDEYEKPKYEVPLAKDPNIKVYCIPKPEVMQGTLFKPEGEIKNTNSRDVWVEYELKVHPTKTRPERNETTILTDEGVIISNSSIGRSKIKGSFSTNDLIPGTLLKTTLWGKQRVIADPPPPEPVKPSKPPLREYTGHYTETVYVVIDGELVEKTRRRSYTYYDYDPSEWREYQNKLDIYYREKAIYDEYMATHEQYKGMWFHKESPWLEGESQCISSVIVDPNKKPPGNKPPALVE